jgi:hypothetical protein
MDNDLISLLIYVALGLVGVIASAYKNKMKKQQAASKPYIPSAPRTFPADPEPVFGPELGPLMELFDIPKKGQAPADYETVELGPSVEEAGMAVDTEEASIELAGMNLDNPESELEKQGVADVAPFEEGQSDIQKMIAKYEAIRKELNQDGIQDDIAMGEIVSVEAEENAKANAGAVERYFIPRKAIIYSEILKRKEY